MLKSLRQPTSKSFKSVIQLHAAYCTKDDERRAKLVRLRFEQKQLYGSVIREDAGKDGSNIDGSPSTRQLNALGGTNNSSNDVRLVTNETASEFHWMVASKNIKIFKSANPKRVYKAQPNRKKPSEAIAKESKHVKIFKSSSQNSQNDDNERPNDTNSTEAPAEKSSESKSTNDEAAPTQTIDDIHTNNDSNTAQMNQNSIYNPKTAIISAKNLLQQFIKTKKTDDQSKKPQKIPFDETALRSMVNYPLVCEKSVPSQEEELMADCLMRLPSISKVLQATMPESARYALRKWKLSKIAELGLDGFKQYEQETFKRGQDFHLAIEDFLNRGEIPESDSSIIKLWESIDSSLNALKPKPILSEQPLLHADLKYKGIIDNVSIVNDELSAFEWKTSEKTKPRLTSTYDAPVQLCAYLGALNADPRYDLTVKNGYVIVAYNNGTAANVFKLSDADLRKYWLIWLQRLQEYWIRVRDGTLPDPI